MFVCCCQKVWGWEAARQSTAPACPSHRILHTLNSTQPPPASTGNNDEEERQKYTRTVSMYCTSVHRIEWEAEGRRRKKKKWGKGGI